MPRAPHCLDALLQLSFDSYSANPAKLPNSACAVDWKGIKKEDESSESLATFSFAL